MPAGNIRPESMRPRTSPSLPDIKFNLKKSASLGYHILPQAQGIIQVQKHFSGIKFFCPRACHPVRRLDTGEMRTNLISYGRCICRGYNTLDAQGESGL